MPKFTFEVDVTGAVEAWEVALWIKDSVNMSHSWRPLWVERVTEVDDYDSYTQGYADGEEDTLEK